MRAKYSSGGVEEEREQERGLADGQQSAVRVPRASVDKRAGQGGEGRVVVVMGRQAGGEARASDKYGGTDGAGWASRLKTALGVSEDARETGLGVRFDALGPVG